jgi:hypothetical protein
VSNHSNPTVASIRRRGPDGVWRRHSLSLILAGVLAALFSLYVASDPSTHIGAFYGNALADWLGTFVFVIATKYFYEIGSSESRTPHPHAHVRAGRFIVRHSLTLVFIVSGAAWIAVYRRVEVDGKAGEVIGNIVSEWTQILGLVIITKYAREAGSKES